MKLSKEQSEQFDREGYLFFPSLFTPAEVKALLDEVPALYAQRRAENVREKGSEAVRTNFAAHMYNRQFAKLARHPRMVEPIRQLFGEAVYMHQFKVNGKMAFDGDVWQWHQDYGTWKNDDQMPEPRAMNVAIFLGEVNEFNGPLMFIPGKPQARCARCATRHVDYQLSVVDHQPRHDPQTRRARRRRCAERPGRIDDPFPFLPGACIELQPVAVGSHQRLPEPVRGLQSYPPLQAPRIHRASRFRADRMPAG